MKRFALALAFFAACLAACSSPAPGGDAAGAGGGEEKTPLLFGIGMHIEPIGATAQLSSAQAANGPDYNNPQTFQKGVEGIEAVAAIVEAHDGKLTVQAQSPFTTAAVAAGSSVLSDLEDAGHEVGLHFHEDAHLGAAGNDLPVDRWCEVMREEVDFIHEAGVERVTFWSGGNLYPHAYAAARCAGLSVNGDWKNPETQGQPAELAGSSPWRPAGGTDGVDVSAFATHDPEGAIVFVPDGRAERGGFGPETRDAAGADEAYFAYLEQSLIEAIQGVDEGKVNVFHFVIHPGEYRGDPDNQYAIIDRFLTEVVDPYVAEGLLEWATMTEMAEAFESWEVEHPGEDPRAGAAAVSAPPPASTPTAPATKPLRPVAETTRSTDGARPRGASADVFDKHIGKD